MTAVLERVANEREQFLLEICRDEPAILEEVRSLLSFGEDTASVLKPLQALDLRPRPLEPGQELGPYRVVRSLGVGGMGSVALAVRRDDFEQEVAIKCLLLPIPDQELLKRFRKERQLLADLQHPNIARILDGGATTEGIPWFAMEYVDGSPIDLHCDALQLPIPRRLEMFLKVCAALSVAHQNLIIHRDLKPTNILVTAEGEPKLLDFGIAKQLTAEATELTRTHQRPMTLEYASPEQVSNQPLATTSDIYSLGVLLYRLLTGRSPYPTEDRGFELARLICEHQISRPSTAIRREGPVTTVGGARLQLSLDLVSQTRQTEPRKLRRTLVGDLDSITLKALEKDPQMRYGSVAELTADLRRYLEGRPVLAREGALAYRAGKFVRRNRGALGLVLVVALVVLGSLVNMGIQRDRVLTEQERTEEMVEFLKNMFEPANPDVIPGNPMTAEALLDHGVELAASRNSDSILQAAIYETLAEQYGHLGLAEKSIAALERAVDLRRRHLGSPHPLLARTLNDLAAAYYKNQNRADAEDLYRESLVMKRALGMSTLEQSKTLSNLASLLVYRGQYEEAESLYQRILTLRRRNYAPTDLDTATVLRKLGHLYWLWGREEEAEPLIRECLEIRMGSLDPETTTLASTYASLARIQRSQGNLTDAEALFLKVLRIRSERLGPDHQNTAYAQRDLAALLLDRAETETARVLLDQAEETLRRQTRADEGWEISDLEIQRGRLLALTGDLEGAETCLHEGLEQIIAQRGERSVYATEARRALSEVQDLLAVGLRALETP